jgi:hypothetical protein
MMTTQRGSGVVLIALFVGVATGLALGLTLTWVVWPVQYYDTDPVDLRSEHKEDYIVLVGAAYAVDGDLARAEARLAKLEEKEIGSMVAGLAERYLREGRAVEETRGLAKLADALDVSTSAMLVYIATPTPLPTFTPEETSIALGPPPPMVPTPTPPATAGLPGATATPEAVFRLLEKRRFCEDQGGGRILVYVRDEEEQGLPNVRITISWPEDEDEFFTGLKPEEDPGYADFEMQQGTVYNLAVAGATGLEGLNTEFSAADCPNTEQPVPSSWRLVFQRGS